MIEAQDCLYKANFFAGRARATEICNRTQFRYYFETTIVWARSVTFILQKQYSKVPGFVEWYTREQGVLNADPLAQFFKDKRNFVLKEKGVHLRKVVRAEMTAHITTVATATVKIIRGSWRSKVRYLPNDILADVRQRMRKVKRPFRLEISRHEPTKDITTDHMYFVEETWNKDPAIDLLDRYIDRLQLLVNDAVIQFGEPG